MSNRPCAYCNTKISMREAMPPATLIRFFEMKRVCKKCGLEDLENLFIKEDWLDLPPDEYDQKIAELKRELAEDLKNFAGPFAPLTPEERAERGITNPHI